MRRWIPNFSSRVNWSADLNSQGIQRSPLRCLSWVCVMVILLAWLSANSSTIERPTSSTLARWLMRSTGPRRLRVLQPITQTPLCTYSQEKCDAIERQEPQAGDAHGDAQVQGGQAPQREQKGTTRQE